MCIYGTVHYGCSRVSSLWLRCNNAPDDTSPENSGDPSNGGESLCDDLQLGPDVYAPPTEGCGYDECVRPECQAWLNGQRLTWEQHQQELQQLEQRLQRIQQRLQHLERKKRKKPLTEDDLQEEEHRREDQIRLEERHARRQRRVEQINREEHFNQEFWTRYSQAKESQTIPAASEEQRKQMAFKMSITTLGLTARESQPPQGQLVLYGQNPVLAAPLELPREMETYSYSQRGGRHRLQGFSLEPQGPQLLLMQGQASLAAAEWYQPETSSQQPQYQHTGTPIAAPVPYLLTAHRQDSLLTTPASQIAGPAYPQAGQKYAPGSYGEALAQALAQAAKVEGEKGAKEEKRRAEEEKMPPEEREAAQKKRAKKKRKDRSRKETKTARENLSEWLKKGGGKGDEGGEGSASASAPYDDRPGVGWR
ncbi:hypothetical protein DL771_002401 [Monosporascus sp. 5C6A]|nr:hypothetical protein DL771_002401 [Monosporascus sp. 5C6A]